MLIDLLPFRLRTAWQSRRHAAACQQILRTAPITARDDGLILFSMMGTRVLIPYLVAVKSLWHQLRRGRIIILDDGTLTAADRAVLAQHLDNPEIRSIREVDVGPCPVGGTWERLLTILDLRRDAYVIQLDSDTVTVGPVPEVTAAIEANRCFTLLGSPEAEISPMACADYAQRFYPDGAPGGHIQHRLEYAMARLPAVEQWRYLRGCSGFAGFARSDSGRSRVNRFAEFMTAEIGSARMHEWGSEQFASNLLIASEADPIALPYAQYSNHWGEGWGETSAFIHFVGTHRYTNGHYARASRIAIAQMLA
jgi:hypothetical protein